MSVKVIKPVEGKRVRLPTGELLTALGVRVPVPIGTYWNRRLLDGDVTVEDEKPAKRARSKE